MSILYRSKRIGKNGKPFWLYKIKTLKDGSDKSPFTTESAYLPLGKFLRKTKLDELPQLWNWLRGDIALVGPRPDEERNINVIPEEYRKVILSIKPGLVDLASIYFYDEEKWLNQLKDPYLYWTSIKPIKILLQFFYVQNKCLLLDVAVLYMTIKKVIGSLWK